MNIYLIAFLIASLDTYYCQKVFFKNYKKTKTLLLLTFLISFYIILLILNYLSDYLIA